MYIAFSVCIDLSVEKGCGCSAEERGSDSSSEVCERKTMLPCNQHRECHCRTLPFVFIFEASTTREPPIKTTEYYPKGKWSWTTELSVVNEVCARIKSTPNSLMTSKFT